MGGRRLSCVFTAISAALLTIRVAAAPDLHAAKRLDYIGVTFRTRTLDEIRQIVSRMRDDLWEHIEAGTLSLPVDSSFPLADARTAHKHMAANLHFGKIVLIP